MHFSCPGRSRQKKKKKKKKRNKKNQKRLICVFSNSKVYQWVSFYMSKSKVVDQSRGWPEGSLSIATWQKCRGSC